MSRPNCVKHSLLRAFSLDWDKMKIVFFCTNMEKWLKSMGSSAWTVCCMPESRRKERKPQLADCSLMNLTPTDCQVVASLGSPASPDSCTISLM